MDIFKEVKERADILKVCDVLGIKLDRNHKTICPFPDHEEKTPSFSISVSKNIFCCFGCDRKGDCITLVQELLNITPLQAALYINDHLELGIETNRKSFETYKEKKRYDILLNRYNEKRTRERYFQKKENETFQILCNYLHLLENWKELNNWEDERYIEALQQIDKIEYWLDEIFIYGTKEDKKWFLSTNGKVVKEYARKLE